MNLLTRTFAAALILIITGFQLLQADPVTSEYSEVELISEQSTIVPGEPFWIGIRMDIKDGWYVYYRNPGDSGMPMTVKWTHEKDFNISDIHWPYPEWLEASGGLTSYGYKDSILYMMEAVAPKDLESGEEITLKVQADWLICEKVCIPEYTDLELTLPVSSQTTFNEEWLPLFSETRRKLPANLNYWTASAEFNDDKAILELTTDAFEIPEYTNIIYFANKEGEIENGAEQPFAIEDNTITMELKKSTYKSGKLERLWGLIYNEDGWDESGNIKALTVDVQIG